MLPAGTPIGRYVVRRKLAEGGMAEIYLASSRGPEGFEKEVVIKRIRSFLASDPGFVQMFIEEARLASRLNHANLVQIFDFDKHEDTYYLAMEYVRGHSLWEVRKRARELMRPMSSTLVAHVGAEVARGLHYAHRLTDAQGKPLRLVHRDVTPHNVLFSYEGAVKLTDFGVAKAGDKQTSAGVLKGKFAYMAPEQSRGEAVDCRTDVFALGIVLWEMLTGGRLFDGDGDLAVLRAVQQSAIAPPARLNPGVPADLDAVVMRALERDPAVRYQTAQELERALALFVLQNARSVDETDVGAYLRGLFSEEAVGEGREASSIVPSPAPVPAEAGREPTVAQRKRPEPAVPVAPAAPSPDEDVSAATYVLEPRQAASRTESPFGGGASPGLRRSLAAGALLLLVGGGAAVVAHHPLKVSAPPTPPDAPQTVRPPMPAVTQPAPPAPAEPTPASASPSVKSAEQSERPKPVMGTLQIQVRPWATVFIDGKEWKEVEGTRTVMLPAGPHHLRLKHPKGVYEGDVSVRPHGTVVFAHSFLTR